MRHILDLTGRIRAAARGSSFLPVFAVWLAIASWLAINKGTWIDEYWTVWKSEPGLRLLYDIQFRSLPDVGHPPLFDVVWWFLGRITGDEIVWRRLVNGLMLGALLLPSLWMSAGARAANGYRSALVLAVLSSPAVVAKFAEHRAYFIDAVALLALLLTTREMFLRLRTGIPIGAPLFGWFVVVALLAIDLDYPNTLSAVPLLAVTFLALLPTDPRRAVAIGATVAAALLVLALQFLLARHIGSTAYPSHVGLARGIGVLLTVTCSGGVVALALVPAAFRNVVDSDLLPISAARRQFACILLIAVGLTCASFVLVEISSRALLARHAISSLPLSAGLIVELATIAPLRRLEVLGLAITAIGSTALTAAVAVRDAGWETFAPKISDQVMSCSSTRVVALDGPALLDRAAALPYVGMKEAFHASFTGVAVKWHFPVELVRSKAWIQPSQKCPTVVWLEQNFGQIGATNQQLAIAAGLHVNGRQLANAIRIDDGSRSVLVIPPTQAADGRPPSR